MDQHLAAIKSSRSRLVSISKALALIFLFAFVLYCVIFGIAFICIAFPPSGFSRVGPSALASILPFAISALAGGFTFFLLWRIFKEISRGISPFTRLRIRQIQALGFLFLAITICSLFIAPGTELGTVDGNSYVLIDSNSSASDSVNIDVTSFMISVVCFALSFIFSYGATLEQEADDLV